MMALLLAWALQVQNPVPSVRTPAPENEPMPFTPERSAVVIARFLKTVELPNVSRLGFAFDRDERGPFWFVSFGDPDAYGTMAVDTHSGAILIYGRHPSSRRTRLTPEGMFARPEVARARLEDLTRRLGLPPRMVALQFFLPRLAKSDEEWNPNDQPSYGLWYEERPFGKPSFNEPNRFLIAVDAADGTLCHLQRNLDTRFPAALPRTRLLAKRVREIALARLKRQERTRGATLLSAPPELGWAVPNGEHGGPPRPKAPPYAARAVFSVGYVLPGNEARAEADDIWVDAATGEIVGGLVYR